jgi:acetone carboxylase gamma subunit
MTITQDDILDELYFVTAFPDLIKALSLPAETVCPELQKLIEQEFVKCFYPDPDSEFKPDMETFGIECRKYFFLATKKGLLAHNSR